MHAHHFKNSNLANHISFYAGDKNWKAAVMTNRIVICCAVIFYSLFYLSIHYGPTIAANPDQSKHRTKGYSLKLKFVVSTYRWNVKTVSSNCPRNQWHFYIFFLKSRSESTTISTVSNIFHLLCENHRRD